MITTDDYLKLQSIAKKIDPVNYLDLVHDSILKHDSYVECIKSLKYNQLKYRSCNIVDNTRDFVCDLVCSKCNKVLPISFFYKRLIMGTAIISYQCKDCEKSYYKEYYKKNRIEIIDRNREYYKINKENIKARARANYNTEYKKEYYLKNKERIALKGKEYRDKNSEIIKQRKRVYNQKKKNKL